jgi:Tfp pilus assembly protein FimT
MNERVQWRSPHAVFRLAKMTVAAAATSSRAGRRSVEGGFSVIELAFVAGLMAVIAAIAVPMMSSSLGNFRLTGDARGIKNEVLLARMQAAANFTRARLYVDLIGKSYRTEIWRSTGVPAWVAQSGARYLSSSTVSYGFGPVSVPPPDTQATIAQAPQCRDAGGQAIANTACILFNSRGIPVDTTGAPTAVYGIYLTDGTAVFGTTVSATSIVRLWRTNQRATPTWVLQ